MPRVSIIIPAYNAARTISACLAAIHRQRYEDVELIAVNDGSTDATERLLRQDPKVKLLNQRNRGAAAARNAGAAAAQGELIIFCDADVTMRPKMLPLMVAALDAHPDAAYAYSSFKFGWKKFTCGAFNAERLRQMPYIHTTSLLRRNLFTGFDETLSRFQDWDLWLTLLKQGGRGIWVPQVLFTVTPGGTMSSWLPSFLYHWPIPFVQRRVANYNNSMEIIRAKHNLPRV